MVNVLKEEDIYTTEDIYALSDGTRAELLDGQIYYMAPPNTDQQRLVRTRQTHFSLYSPEPYPCHLPEYFTYAPEYIFLTAGR